jgi:hypothetical protein
MNAFVVASERSAVLFEHRKLPLDDLGLKRAGKVAGIALPVDELERQLYGNSPDHASVEGYRCPAANPELTGWYRNATGIGGNSPRPVHILGI